MDNNQGRKSRFRIVERSGQTVRDIIGTGYPWNYEKCDKEDCFLCRTSIKKNVSCQKQGMAYQILCTACSNQGVISEYEGETGRSLYARGSQHLSEFRRQVTSNCMTIHNVVHHGGSYEFHFRMEAKGRFMSPLDRQVNESMRIRHSEANILMNSGSEWRADRIPRAVFWAPGFERQGNP